MAKLTKPQANNHAQACKLLEKEKLSLEEKNFVLEHWREDATHINSVSGAFFTPPALARDFSIEVTGPCVIDLCAGIGSLAFAAWHHHTFDRRSLNRITCVEINPDYIAVGKKLLPEADWIQADVFHLPKDLARFDCVIANPPFGATKKSGKAPRFTGNIFEYRVIDIASDIGDYGVFIIPQSSAPFELSGKQCYRRSEHEKYRYFHAQTAITLGANCGFDTSVHRNDWTVVPPAVEIVTSDLREAREARASATESSQRDSDSACTAQCENSRNAGDTEKHFMFQPELF
jgi:predicted RNA methylase